MGQDRLIIDHVVWWKNTNLSVDPLGDDPGRILLTRLTSHVEIVRPSENL